MTVRVAAPPRIAPAGASRLRSASTSSSCSLGVVAISLVAVDDVVADRAGKQERLLQDEADLRARVLRGRRTGCRGRRARRVPRVGSYSRAISDAVVVLPPPVGPTSAYVLPRSSAKVASRSTSLAARIAERRRARMPERRCPVRRSRPARSACSIRAPAPRRCDRALPAPAGTATRPRRAAGAACKSCSRTAGIR